MKSFLTRRTSVIIGGVALLAAGGTAGAVAGHMMQPAIQMAPLKPVAIRGLVADDDAIVTVRGRVTDVFGNRFVLDDGTAHALIDTGPRGDDAALVQTGGTATIQGRFDHGQIRASFLVGADGKVTALGPMHGSPDRGPRHDRGGPGRHDRDDAPPPPPPPAAAAAAPAPAVAAPTTSPAA